MLISNCPFFYYQPYFIRRQIAEDEEENAESVPSSSTSSKQQPTFQGTSHTLTGKSFKSSGKKQDESDKKSKEGEEEVVRTVALYDNGFMISGPGMEDTFKDYADEQNTRLLDQISDGMVQLQEMKIKPYQKVLLRIDYKQGVQYQSSSETPAKFVGTAKKLDSGAKAEKHKEKPSSSTDPASSIQPEFPCDPAKPSTALQVRCKNGRRISIRVNMDTTLIEIINFVSACLGIKSNDCVLISMTNATLSDKSNHARTVAELDIQNSVLTQK